jgi:hypothetical protein
MNSKKTLTELIDLMIAKKVSALKFGGIELVLRDDAFYKAEEAKVPKAKKIGAEPLFPKDEGIDEELLYASS